MSLLFYSLDTPIVQTYKRYKVKLNRIWLSRICLRNPIMGAPNMFFAGFVTYDKT